MVKQPVKQVKNKSPNPTGKGGFKKGESGNPKGRPPAGKSFAERIRETVSDEDWTKIIEKATEQALTGDKAARDFLLDRTEGKPNQSIAYTEKKLEPLEGIVIE
jgi:hypothetical protein